MLDIGVKMKELLDELQNTGINGVQFPDASFDGDPTSDYAILCNLFPDDFGVSYFDYDSCRQDFVDRVKGQFAGDPTVTLTFDGFNYVEAHRK